MADESEERTEQATAHKLRESRKRGEVAFSRDLTDASAFAAAILLLWLGGGFIELQFRRILDAALDVVAAGGGSPHLEPAIVQMLIAMVYVVGPLLLLAMAVALLVGLAQTRGVLSGEPMKIRFERMNPAESLKQLFSTRQLGMLIQLLLKVCVLTALLVWTVRAFLQPFILGMYGETGNTGLAGLTAMQVLFGATALVFVVLGTADFVHQYFEHLKANRMTKTERKREHKDLDGDPQLKGELRRQQREMRQSPVKAGLGSANVVVTNPTHFAVALYYEPGVVDLPVVVAKGEDAAALQMRGEAGRRFIPILENPPLARSLHRSVGLGEYIGEEHVEAVAEVFRWLATLRGQAAGKPGAAVASQ